MKQYEIEEYLDRDGKTPFRDWLLCLKDVVAKAMLTARIDRAAHGNFGDWKSIKSASGVFEIREHYGPGYRIFYSVLAKRSFSCSLVLLSEIRRKQLPWQKNA